MYHTQLEVLEFETNILTTKVTGNFEGSPIVLKYHFELKEGKIDRLQITN
jgi:hypothetical protein